MSSFVLGFAYSAFFLPPLIAFALCKKAFAVGLSLEE